MNRRWLTALFVVVFALPAFAQKSDRRGESTPQPKQVGNFIFSPSQGYLKTPDGPAREFTLILDEPLYAGGKLTVEAAGKTRVIDIAPSTEGINEITNTFPAGYMDEAVEVAVSLTGRQGNIKKSQLVEAARQWTLYFLPHSHLDIGYTHRQDDVMKLQWRNLEQAIELASSTATYPEGSRYKWNAEATWPVAGYLEEYKGSEKERALIEAIREGHIGMDATLGSILTGICKQEELTHLFDDAHRIAALTGTLINTAMMSDVPGQSWGTVNAMAQNGVRYFSSGPNYVPTLGRMGSHGVGLYNLKWGDLPCWWQSQSGGDKILYWQTGKGYSMFHGWLMDKLSVCGTKPVWQYLAELEQREYPYSLTYLRYTIHGDNGPPDSEMPDVIARWNEKYDSPRFVIGTTKELFTEMERLYGDVLPVYSGDMTPVWEDGAASTARELAMNRESSERLNQAEIVWSMLRPAADYPHDKFHRAWKNAILFSEHTWGSAASGPEPESEFTKDLWAMKKSYADSAALLSKDVFKQALSALGGKGDYVQVVNTNVWRRSDVVALETDTDLNGKMLLSPLGEKIPLQRLHDGRWIFYAAELPELSSAAYRIVAGDAKKHSASMISGTVMSNGRVKMEIDPSTGVISSFKIDGDDYEYVAERGLNDFIYSGKSGADPCGIDKVTGINILNDGEVAATLRIEAQAPGCRSFYRDVTIYRDIDRVDITNTMGRLNVYDHENVRFVFPFNFPTPEISMDVPMGVVHPERDQLEGANKNFYSVLNGLSVSDIERGIYLTTVDAPFVEVGEMTADISRNKGGLGWMNAAKISPTVYSWVMNNRWRTNYKASQEGVAVFRYSLQTFHPERHLLRRHGMEQAQKPISVISSRHTSNGSLFRIKGSNRVGISTLRPIENQQAYLLRLQNMGASPVNPAIVWLGLQPSAVYLCDNNGNIIGDFDPASFWLKPYDFISLKLML